MHGMFPSTSQPWLQGTRWSIRRVGVFRSSLPLQDGSFLSFLLLRTRVRWYQVFPLVSFRTDWHGFDCFEFPCTCSRVFHHHHHHHHRVWNVVECSNASVHCRIHASFPLWFVSHVERVSFFCFHVFSLHATSIVPSWPSEWVGRPPSSRATRTTWTILSLAEKDNPSETTRFKTMANGHEEPNTTRQTMQKEMQ